jgi:outer membrane protein OmpA-like peptidoglycan-associated protein
MSRKELLHIGVMGALLVGLCLAPAALRAQDKRKAEKALATGNIVLARTQYLALTKQAPDNADYWHGLGISYLHGAERNKAEEIIAKAITLAGEKAPPEWRYDYGLALQANLKFKEAMAEFMPSDPLGKRRTLVSRRIYECKMGMNLVAAPQPYQISNVAALNSPANDYLPLVTADGELMYLTSRRKGSSSNVLDPEDGMPHEDVYLSRRKGGAWGGAGLVGPPINSRDNDACVGIAADGNTMFLYRGKNGGDIFLSKKQGGKWTEPEPFEYNSKAFESSACLSADGNQLFFVSDRFGSKDILVCRKSGSGKWKAPTRLNNSVNTPQDEESPFLSSDGRTLYFSSNGQSNMGGYDIFKVSINSGGAYGAAQNMGYPLNSTGDDLFFSISPDERTGYFASEKPEGKGLLDIYAVAMPAKSQPALVMLQGHVLEEQTRKPIVATITITDNVLGQVLQTLNSDAADGHFIVALPSGRNYGITVEKDGHLFYSDNVTMSESSGFIEIKREIDLPLARVGARIILKNLFFDTDKFDLRPESLPELNRLVKLLTNLPRLRIEVSGHTDNQGENAHNVVLSQNRAKAVVAYLVEKGIAASRLVPKGYSSSKPVAGNATPEGRQQNRRTEMLVIK